MIETTRPLTRWLTEYFLSTSSHGYGVFGEAAHLRRGIVPGGAEKGHAACIGETEGVGVLDYVESLHANQGAGVRALQADQHLPAPGLSHQLQQLFIIRDRDVGLGEPFDPERDYHAMRNRRLVQLQLRNGAEVAAVFITPRPVQ